MDQKPICFYSPLPTPPPFRGQPTEKYLPEDSPSKGWQSTVDWGDWRIRTRLQVNSLLSLPVSHHLFLLFWEPIKKKNQLNTVFGRPNRFWKNLSGSSSYMYNDWCYFFVWLRSSFKYFLFLLSQRRQPMANHLIKTWHSSQTLRRLGRCQTACQQDGSQPFSHQTKCHLYGTLL